MPIQGTKSDGSSTTHPLPHRDPFDRHPALADIYRWDNGEVILGTGAASRGRG